MKNNLSEHNFKEAKKFIPGGVNSPVRAFKSVGGNPIFIKKAKNQYLYDVDGNQYIDFISSWGPMILGHSNEKILNSVKNKIDLGTSFGIPTELETKIAKLCVKMVPNIDKIRFVNSGTEACMSAVRLARGYTKKDKIIKFEGCYHGHADSFLIQAGSGAVTMGSPNSPGITQGTARDTLIAEYNNIESVKNLFKNNKDQIAAVIIEPVAGNMGCIPPIKNFLEEIRYLCDENKSLLIFDEVMTGFRLSTGGAQERLNIRADIVTFGKVIGGGFPVGAFASSNSIMDSLAPQGKIYQAGTLSGNPIAMQAGYNTLKYLNENKSVYVELDKKTQKLDRGMKMILEKNNLSFKVNCFGSMISVHFSDVEIIDFKSAVTGDNEIFKKFFHFFLEKGIYFPPSPYESCFLNNSITNENIDYVLNTFESFLKKNNLTVKY
ncbi:MAG: glutamate-1-semialdehyde 2,1-aminomutase [Bacteroidota bacterium]|nr:glutamate-1-semialdehyde 2,1-aminomutase [Bacteroidota bacterium]